LIDSYKESEEVEDVLRVFLCFLRWCLAYVRWLLNLSLQNSQLKDTLNKLAKKREVEPLTSTFRRKTQDVAKSKHPLVSLAIIGISVHCQPVIRIYFSWPGTRFTVWRMLHICKDCVFG
jgi:hypothetical protein